MTMRFWRVAGSVVVTAGLLFLVLRAIRPAELAETLSRVNLGLLVVAAVAAFAFACARAWRYHVLLGRERVASTRALVPISLASWGVSLLLPGPTGDGTFVWLIRSRLGTPISLGAGAVIISRLLDVISLVLIALLSAPLAGGIVPRVGLVLGSLVAIVMVIVLVGLFWDRPRRAIVPRLAQVPVAGRLVARVEPALHELGEGSRPLALIAGTAAARLATSIQYLALFAAIGQPLSYWQVWFALSIRTLLLGIPVQGIGGLGTGQLWWTGALTLLGWPVEDALAASLAIHLLDLAISLPQGGAGWLILLISRRRQVAAERTEGAEAEAQRV
jgi:glycosyltransferase 2 family protein